MRVKVAEPITSSAPTAWRTARWKLRSCWNTGRQSVTRARKRVSNTAGGSRLYLYQGPAQAHPLPIKNESYLMQDEPEERVRFSHKMSLKGRGVAHAGD